MATRNPVFLTSCGSPAVFYPHDFTTDFCTSQVVVAGFFHQTDRFPRCSPTFRSHPLSGAEVFGPHLAWMIWFQRASWLLCYHTWQKRYVSKHPWWRLKRFPTVPHLRNCRCWKCDWNIFCPYNWAENLLFGKWGQIFPVLWSNHFGIRKKHASQLWVGWTLNDFGVMNCEITLLKAWGKDSFVCLILNQKGWTNPPTRWFKPWPFDPLVGGHLPFERVT